jgi:chitinase
VKVLPSVGGWTLSDPFFSMAGNDANRKVFVDSVITFLQKYELFDGVDIDWEFPGGGGASVGLGSSDDGQAYVVLMKDLREALDGLSKETGRDYELTSAIGAAPKMVDAVDYESAAPYMDYIFAMTYDYYGAWGSDLGHLTALHESDNNDLNAGYNVAASIENLIEAGVPASKLVLGVAMYGRGWKGVTGVSGNSPFTGEGGGPIKGSWEAGIIDYKDIASQYAGAKSEGLAGFTYSYDETAEAPYLYNATTGELISYDNPRSVKAKRAYAAKMGLAGLFSWEIDGDNGAILEAMSGI